MTPPVIGIGRRRRGSRLETVPSRQQQWGFWRVVVCALGLATSHAPGHGAYHDSLKVVNEQMAKAPSDGNLWAVRAGLHVGHEEGPAALADIEAAQQRGVAAANLALLKARALLVTGKNQEAEASARGFVAAHPGDPLAHWVHAQALAALGRSDECLAEQRVALQLRPKADEEWYLEHVALLVDGSLKAEAVATLDKALAAHGPTPSLLLRAMDLEVALGRFDGALTRVAALQRQAPRPEPWMAKRARLLETAGRREEARAAWEEMRRHIAQLPNLERGSAEISRLHAEALTALGSNIQPPVTAPPAP